MKRCYIAIRRVSRRNKVKTIWDKTKIRYPNDFRIRTGYLYRDRNMKINVSSNSVLEGRKPDSFFECFDRKIGLYKCCKMNKRNRKSYRYAIASNSGSFTHSTIGLANGHIKTGRAIRAKKICFEDAPFKNFDQFVGEDYKFIYSMMLFNKGEELIFLSKRPSTSMLNVIKKVFTKKDSVRLVERKQHLTFYNVLLYSIKNEDKRILDYLSERFPDLFVICINRIACRKETLKRIGFTKKLRIMKTFYKKAFKKLYIMQETGKRMNYHFLRISFFKLRKDRYDYRMCDCLLEEGFGKFLLKFRKEFSIISKKEKDTLTKHSIKENENGDSR